MTEKDRYSFKNLELWKAAQKVAVQVSRLSDELPASRSADVIARQLIRSATSIPANIAEGHGRYSLAAYRNHLSIAKGSASECQSWLDLLVQMGHVSVEAGRDLDSACTTLIAALTRRIVALENQEKSARIREDGPVYQAGDEPVPGFQGSRVPGPPGEVGR